MKTAYCIPVETGRGHTWERLSENSRKNSEQTCNITQRRTTLKNKAKSHRKKTTISETSKPQETAHSKWKAGKINLALTGQDISERVRQREPAREREREREKKKEKNRKEKKRKEKKEKKKERKKEGKKERKKGKPK